MVQLDQSFLILVDYHIMVLSQTISGLSAFQILLEAGRWFASRRIK